MIAFFRLAYHICQLARAERLGYSFALASSWCGERGGGTWVVWVRRPDAPGPLRPIKVGDLAAAIRAAVEATR